MRNVELGTRVCRGYAVVVLRGELDTRDAEDTAAAVAALAAGGQQLIIDLENLAFIDCHAAGALRGARETARQAGGEVLLAAPHGPVLRLLTLLGVPAVHASVAAAADSAGLRDARRRAVSTVRSGSAALAGARYWMTAWRAAVPGSRAGNRSWSPR
ncbi:MAG TPA: STAS domain-containing protein [Streptosporangiaceae bacterium]|nr:STAS domain-containing protein [Streptosporangiaceae bacterium]